MNKPRTNQEGAELPFRISSRTTVLLGRESISSPVVAISELVKNAYDADAKHVTVKFRKASTPEGIIEINDDGQGMNYQDILNKWMVIGTDTKEKEPISPKGRVRVGEKGIGRFALDRLAETSVIETTPEDSPDEPRYRITIDWKKYENTEQELQEIKHPITKLKRWNDSGTRIKLNDLRDRWNKRDYNNLYQNLVILVPPFEKNKTAFQIKLDCDETPDLSGVVQSPMAGAALFRMSSSLTDDGTVKIKIDTRDNSAEGKFRQFAKYSRNWTDIFDLSPEEKRMPDCGPLEFELHFYLREADSLRGTDVSLTKLREYLDIYGGIRIFRDGFRVKPYGDPGKYGDWLGLSARRVQNPAGVRSKRHPRWVVAENQVVGSVFINREANPKLRDQTNREGLFENKAFLDLQRFILKSIEIFETDRKIYELEKLDTKDDKEISIGEKIQASINSLTSEAEKIKEIIEVFPREIEKKETINNIESFLRKQIDDLEEIVSLKEFEEEDLMTERHLYQNLATIGVAVSSMGHEIIGLANKTQRTIKQLKTRISELGFLTDQIVMELIKKLENYGRYIYSVSYLALSHIDRDKRRRKKINPDKVIGKVYEDTLLEFAQMNKANIEFIPGKVPAIFAFPYELESIVINFVTNSLAAFVRGRIPTEDRAIEIETRFDKKNKELNIITRDSGPGIHEDDIARIFGMYSTKVDDEGRPVGTGLGLKIVKDIVDSHRGTIEVKSKGTKLKGAEFSVKIPVSRK